MAEDAKKILTVYHPNGLWTVEFVKDYGVTCVGLVPRTGSAMMVAEALWSCRWCKIEYHATTIVNRLDLMPYMRDLYDALNIGFQSWSRS